MALQLALAPAALPAEARAIPTLEPADDGDARWDREPLLFAVVVGHNDGWGVLPQLRYADDDALRFYRLALQLAPRSNVALLTELDVQTWRRLQDNGTPPPPFLPPTKSKLLKVIDLFKRQIAKARRTDPDRPVHLLLFFSGHGETGYFFLKRRGDQQRDAALTGADLRRALADSKATLNGLFVDACKSKSLFLPKGGDAELGPDFSAWIREVEQASMQAPIGVLTSTISDRPAGEAADIGAGYFSHVLTSGLSGAADADSDGTVRYDELVAFVSFHTRRISGQQPWFRPPEGLLKAPLVRLRSRNDVLQIPPGVGGHFAVFDAETDALQAEVHKSASQWTRLILPPGRYRVVWVQSRQVGRMALATMQGQPVQLVRGSFSGQVPLGRWNLPKGEPADLADDAPHSGLATFDPGHSGFDQPFTARVVNTMATAYSAGLTAAEKLFSGPEPVRHEIEVGYGLYQAPVEAADLGQGVSLRYGYRLTESIRLAGRSAFAFSTHNAAPGSFRMYRLMLQVEGLYTLRLFGRLGLAAGPYLGWQMVLLTSNTRVPCGELQEDQCDATALSGDASGLRAGLLASLRVAVLQGWAVGATFGYGLELVHQQQEGGENGAEVFFRPHALGHVSYSF